MVLFSLVVYDGEILPWLIISMQMLPGVNRILRLRARFILGMSLWSLLLKRRRTLLLHLLFQSLCHSPIPFNHPPPRLPILLRRAPQVRRPFPRVQENRSPPGDPPISLILSIFIPISANSIMTFPIISCSVFPLPPSPCISACTASPMVGTATGRRKASQNCASFAIFPSKLFEKPSRNSSPLDASGKNSLTITKQPSIEYFCRLNVVILILLCQIIPWQYLLLLELRLKIFPAFPCPFKIPTMSLPSVKITRGMIPVLLSIVFWGEGILFLGVKIIPYNLYISLPQPF